MSFVYPGDEAGRRLDTLGATTAWPTRAICWVKDRAAIVGGAVFAFAIGLSVVSTIAADFVAIDAKRIEDYASSGFACRERDVDPATIPLPPGLPVPKVGSRMRCSACGSRQIETKPKLYPGGIEAMRQRRREI